MSTSHLVASIFMATWLISFPAGCSGRQPHPVPELPVNSPPATGRLQDRDPLPLARMICMSDLIVFGMVESVGADNYRFHAETVIWGEEKHLALTVGQYIPNKFDGPRAIPYKVGLQYLLFLQYDNSQMVWKVLGSGGEGELPVEGAYVYFPGRSLEGLEKKRYLVQEVEQEMPRYEFDTFVAALKDFKSCFVYKPDAADRHSAHVYQRICPDETVTKWQDASFMHRYLIRHMR